MRNENRETLPFDVFLSRNREDKLADAKNAILGTLPMTYREELIEVGLSL